LYCVDWFVVLSDWRAGRVALASTLRMRDAIFDGLQVYAPGDYVYQYDVSVR
jgi:hypothetical protein